MAEALSRNVEGGQELESTTVGIMRTSAVVKGGRRFSFSALVVVGDRRGRVGVGYGKAPGVPAAIEKAQKDANKQLFKVTLKDGTFPHPVEARFGASIVRLIPAAPGTGVVAGGTVRAVLEMVGVRDALTKAMGSTNKINLVKATLEGLKSMRNKDEIANLRGVTIESSVVEEKLAMGQRYAPKSSGDEGNRNRGPVNTIGQKSSGGRGRGGGGRSGGGGGRSSSGGGRGRSQQSEGPAGDAAPATPAPTATPATAAPASAAPAA